VKKVEIKLGKWWVGGFTLFIRPNIDLRLYTAAQDAIDVLAGVVEPLVDSMKMYWEDDKERAKFCELVRRDMADESYHLYTPMYIFLLCG